MTRVGEIELTARLVNCQSAGGHNERSWLETVANVRERLLLHRVEFPLVPYTTRQYVSNSGMRNPVAWLSSRQVPRLYDSDPMGCRAHGGIGTRSQSQPRDYGRQSEPLRLRVE